MATAIYNSVRQITKITIDAEIFPEDPGDRAAGMGPKTKRFYVSVPILGKSGGLQCVYGDIPATAG